MKLRGGARSLARHGLWVLLVAELGGACNLDNPGVSPPDGKLAYPVALVLAKSSAAAAPRYLYVANSNFDVAYNAGSIQAYDLDKLSRAIKAGGCLELGVLDDGAGGDAGTFEVPGVGADAGAVELPSDYEVASRYGTPRGVLCDGLDPEGYEACCFSDNQAFLRDELRIDSFATGLALRPDGKRLYVPLRSSNSLVYADVNGGKLSCGSDKGRCTRGRDPDSKDDVPDSSLPPQPTSLTVGRLADLGSTKAGTFIATVHDQGELSLFIERNGGAPLLEDVRGGGAPRATSVSVDPLRELLYVTAASVNYVQRYGVYIAERSVEGEDKPRELLQPSTPVLLTELPAQASVDLRDLVVDPNDPARLLALVRGSEQALAFLRLDATTVAEARLIDAVRVGAGPSRLILMELEGRTFALVSCYDSRAIFVIDTESRELVEVIRGVSGPFEMVADPVRRALYVADFRASVVRVIDVSALVDQRLPPPRIVATLGEPSFAGGL